MTALFSQMAVIVGAMKAGTSSLFNYLRQHPQIAASQKKEPNFFLGLTPIPDFLSYYRLWNFDPRRHRLAMEGSTGYTKAPVKGGAFARMKRTSFDFRFLYILRDPVARLESHIKHNIVRQGESPTHYDVTAGHRIAVSSYAFQIDRMLEHFSRDQLLLLSFEQLCQDPQAVLGEACEFLGVDAFRCQDLEPKGKKTTASLASWSLRDAERETVYRLLEKDLARLRDVYGFDISTFASVRQHQRTQSSAKVRAPQGVS